MARVGCPCLLTALCSCSWAWAAWEAGLEHVLWFWPGAIFPSRASRALFEGVSTWPDWLLSWLVGGPEVAGVLVSLATAKGLAGPVFLAFSQRKLGCARTRFCFGRRLSGLILIPFRLAIAVARPGEVHQIGLHVG